MSDLTELRKQIYNFGWILSKDNLNPPNMCLRTIFNENSTDMLQINIPVSSKMCIRDRIYTVCLRYHHLILSCDI